MKCSSSYSYVKSCSNDINIDHMKLTKKIKKDVTMIISWTDENIILLTNERVAVDRGVLVVI